MAGPRCCCCVSVTVSAVLQFPLSTCLISPPFCPPSLFRFLALVCPLFSHVCLQSIPQKFTVIMDAGAGGNYLEWHFVQPLLEKQGIRSCSFDRMGKCEKLKTRKFSKSMTKCIAIRTWFLSCPFCFPPSHTLAFLTCCSFSFLFLFVLRLSHPFFLCPSSSALLSLSPLFALHLSCHLSSLLSLLSFFFVGLGFSSALVQQPQTLQLDNEHLHELLVSSGENTQNLIYLGFSRGGLLGVSFANTYPEMVKGLVLVDPMYVYPFLSLRFPFVFLLAFIHPTLFFLFLLFSSLFIMSHSSSHTYYITRNTRA